MIHWRHGRFVLGGLLVAVAIAVSYGLGRYWAQPRPRQITIQVTGAPEITVSGAFEIDSVPGAPREARLPAVFACRGHNVAFTVQRVGGPDQPITAAVDIDGVRRGVGTAAACVRVDIWTGDHEPRFLATPSEPEWKETREAGPRPDLIGTRPPEWTPVEWINTEPLRLADLRGNVVLARWFTGPHCDDCSATAPALREFDERYRDLGLAVVGMYHHADDTLEEVRKTVNGYGYRFPVGIDRGARTRRLWCLGRYDYGYTSVSFLLDRQGVIRHIHPGGRYVKGDADYHELEWQIEQLLAELPLDGAGW
jgi:peroxiredoxin